MALLNKDQLLAGISKLPTLDVPVPELGGSVRVRTLSGAVRDRFEASLYGDKEKINLENVRARLVSIAVIDEAGNPMFNELDASILGRGSAKVLDRLYVAAKKLNGIEDEDVEEILKNARTAATGSSSPNASA